MGENIWWLYIWEKVNIHNIKETPKCDSNQRTGQNKKTNYTNDLILKIARDFPGGPVVKTPPASTGETWVWSVVREDPAYLGAPKPVGNNYWACALERRSCNYWSPNALESVLHKKRGPLSTTREQPPLTTTRESLHVSTKTQHSHNYMYK